MKNTVILISLLLTTWMAQAQTVPDLVVKCSKETDSLKRLVCYDNVADKVKKMPAVVENIRTSEPIRDIPPSPVSVSVETPKMAVADTVPSESEIEERSEKISQFGMEHKIVRKSSEEKIYAHVSSIKKDHYGKLSLKLDNDQSWKQTDSSTLRLKVGEQLYIERGALGSFFMGKEGVNRRIRVKRTK
ncbi:MAG: hypothetical protein ACI808_000959 [Paraglaciecola sp.]|jgi:hypothetical protein